ncbi:MAG: hypothetical protein KAI79_01445, partial [Bacteroidales bacterium]|nr:hypothetical protein [Bacteroidales bacterium]
MKQFNEDFKTKLYQIVEDIENNSLIEVVAVIKAQTRSYRDVSLLGGAVVLFLAYTYLMFAPTIFDVYLIYFLSIIGFLIGFSIVEFIPPIKRMLIPKKKLDRDVE